MTRARERSTAAVPRPVKAFLALALAAQIAWHAQLPKLRPKAADLPHPPSVAALRLASLGEPVAAAKLLMLYVQSFDIQPGLIIPYEDLDYERLTAWLAVILELDPRAEYPLFAASRLYADVPDPAKERQMLDFIYREFLKDPGHRWRWLAEAALLAKYRLKDLPLALKYAEAIRTRATGKGVPDWARELQIFVLADMNQLQAAKVLLGELFTSGQIKDPSEARFLKHYLDRLEKKKQP